MVFPAATDNMQMVGVVVYQWLSVDAEILMSVCHSYSPFTFFQLNMLYILYKKVSLEGAFKCYKEKVN